MTIASAPASKRASARSKVSDVTPTAPATKRRPNSSLAAFGNSITFSMSLIVIRPESRPLLSTKGSFSIRCSWRMRSAVSRSVPTGAVTKLSLVMCSEISDSKSVIKRMSRLVIIPTNLRFSRVSTIGTPEIR